MVTQYFNCKGNLKDDYRNDYENYVTESKKKVELILKFASFLI